MNNQDAFEFSPQSDHPEDQLVPQTISSFPLQAIAGLIIKLGDIAKVHFPEDGDEGDYLSGQWLVALGKEFGGQVMSQCYHVQAVDLDKDIPFTIPATYTAKVCRILTDALRRGKITPDMHEAWTPFAKAALLLTPDGEALLRRAEFHKDNPGHPGLRAHLN